MVLFTRNFELFSDSILLNNSVKIQCKFCERNIVLWLADKDGYWLYKLLLWLIGNCY